MANLVLAVALLGQCSNGTCSVPSKTVSYSYSYQSPTLTYQSSYSGSGAVSGEAGQSCTKQRRGLLKRLFRNR